MFSKRIWKVLLNLFIFFFAVVLTLGCSRFLDTQKNEENVIDMTDPQLVCLQQVNPVLKKVFDGSVQSSEVEFVVNCTEKSLDVFKKRYRGSMNKAYTAQDLNSFFNRYFFKEKPITNSLMISILKLKAALFGGDSSSVSQQEMDLFVEWFQSMKGPLLEISQDIPYLTFQKTFQGTSRDTSPEMDHESKLARLETFVYRALEKTVIWSAAYSLSEFEALAKEGIEFADSKEQSRLILKMNRFFPLIPALKGILTGEDVPTGKEQKIEMLKSYIRVYGAALYAFHNRIFEKRLFGNLDSASKLLEFAQKLVTALQESPQVKKTSQIKIDYIDKGVEALIKAGILGSRFEVASSQEAFRKIFQKLFDSRERLENKVLRGLHRDDLLELKKEILLFRVPTELLKEKFSSPSMDLEDYKEALSDQRIKSKIQELFSTEEFSFGARERMRESLFSDLQQVRKVMETGKPTKFNSQLALQIDGVFEKVLFSDEGLAQVVLIEGFTRLLTRGYGELRRQPIHLRTISIEQLNRWHQDFREFGTRLLVFDPRSANMNSRFYEANYFTASGNGDSAMQYQETFEYLNFLFSAGISSAETLRKELLSHNCHLLPPEGKTELDVFGQFKMSKNCTRAVLKDKFSILFSNLPIMVSHILRKNDFEFLGFFEILEKAALGKQPDVYDTGDLRAFVGAFHYVESLFTLFDEDKNGELDVIEIRRASPRFLGLISKAIKDLLPQLSPYVDFSPAHCRVRTTFEYFLLYGKKPSALQTAWILSCWGPSASEKATRDHVFKVLMELRSKLQ